MRGKKREAPKAGHQGDLQLKPPGSFRLSDGIKEGGRCSPRVAAIIQSLEDALNEYERKRPQRSTKPIYDVLLDGLQCLRTYIEDPNEKETSWSCPAAKFHYAVNWNWEEKRLESGVITDEDFEEKDHLAGKLKNIAIAHRNIFALQIFTNFAAYLKQGGQLLSSA